MKTIICFIRHGQTDWNKQTRIQGSINNLLNETGKKQARLLGNYLKTNDQNWDVIISSPLERAHETARIILEELQLPIDITTEPKFTEREFGEAEGALITPEIYKNVFSDNINGLEKTKTIQNRVYDGVLSLAQKYPGQRVLVIAHSHVIKGLLTKLDKKYSFSDEMQNSALNFFAVENDKITVEKINIKTHLQ